MSEALYGCMLILGNIIKLKFDIELIIHISTIALVNAG